MTKLTAKTIHWLKDTLSNNEEASTEELLAYFMQAGALTQAEAQAWVDRRKYYIWGNWLRQKMVAVLPRQRACPNCAGRQMKVVLYPKEWWLECVQCGDILPEEEQTFASGYDFVNPTCLHPVES